MKLFIEILKSRNEVLFYFGLINLVSALVFLILTQTSHTQVAGVNAWFKPFKFALSTFFYAWSMAWYVHYLPHFDSKVFNWSVVLLLGFEVVYIALQAGRGQLSHYNISTPTTSLLYSLMALAATLVTLYTAYICILFFQNHGVDLPNHYVWGIRLGLLFFVIFSFEGFVMGSRMAHTVGAPDGSAGLPLVNWSKKYGDLRISHFLGMHALQLLPLVAFYLIKHVKGVLVFGVLYFLFCVASFIIAWQGKSLFR